MAKKKTGRKILGSSVAHPLTFRIDDVLRERLQQEADKRAERKHGWNLSQEILMRLNQSLDGDEKDKRKRGPLWAISYLMGQIEINGLLSILLTDQFERRARRVQHDGASGLLPIARGALCVRLHRAGWADHHDLLG